MKRTLGFTIFALLTLAAVAAAEPPSMKVTLTLPSKYREALATKSAVIRASSERGLPDVTRGLERATKKPAAR